MNRSGDLNKEDLAELIKAFPNGREDVKAVLEGRKEICLKDVFGLLVDGSGRCIPTANQGVTTALVRARPNPNYRLGRCQASDFNPVSILERFPSLFGQEPTIILEEFVARINALITKITSDKLIKNLLRGAWYPVLTPKIPKGDYGTVLERNLLPAVKRGYENEFPECTFVSHVEDLEKQVTIVDGRHEQVITDMQSKQLVGIVCYCMQDFPIPAQHQMAELMPDYFSLLGGIDGSVAEALYPNELSWGNSNPTRDCSAVQWRNSGYSLCFHVFKHELCLYRRDPGADKDGHYIGGFFLRG
jgi:hypothetical protein